MTIPAQINTIRTFPVFSDPGHAWAAVPCAYLRMLGIADKVSHYSYVSASKKTAYLEEDSDLSLFVNTWRAKYGANPLLREHSNSNRSSSIRRLENYSA